MPTYTQCFTVNPTVRETAGYPYYPGGGPHGGIDTVLSPDINIYAPLAGTVIVANHWNGSTSGNQSWGNYVVVEFGTNEYYLVGHMQSMERTVGETLSQGQYIGKMGATGNVTGPHTHWEWWHGGRGTSYRVDPSPILGIPNGVGTYDVVWGAPTPPIPPTPPTPTTRRKMPLWMMLRRIR